LPKITILKSFLTELPLLHRLYLSRWFEDPCECNVEDVIDRYSRKGTQVNLLRRCMKPHRDGYDYMYLDMRALRNHVGEFSV
jgi:hypothetical protein